jgi:ankyrin repeat protein
MGDGEFEGEALDDHEISALTQIGLRLTDAILSRATFEDIQTLVAEGAPVWFQDEDEGISPLHAAAYTQQQDVAKLLIDAGAPWNAGASPSRPLVAAIGLSFQWIISKPPRRTSHFR